MFLCKLPCRGYIQNRPTASVILHLQWPRQIHNIDAAVHSICWDNRLCVCVCVKWLEAMFDLNRAATDTWSPGEQSTPETFTPLVTFSPPTTVSAHSVCPDTEHTNTPTSGPGFFILKLKDITTNVWSSTRSHVYTSCVKFYFVKCNAALKWTQNVVTMKEIIKKKSLWNLFNQSHCIKCVHAPPISSTTILLNIYFVFYRKTIS